MQKHASRAEGFTLIELMITVAIVGILAAIAYPSYIAYIVKSNRRAAQSFIQEVSGQQQRYLLDARSYAPNLAALQFSVPSDVGTNYTVVTEPKPGTTPPGFTVTATAIGTQAARDGNCAKLVVDEAGAKTSADASDGATTACW